MFNKIVILLITVKLSLSAIEDIKVISSNVDIKEEEHVISTIFNLFEKENQNKIIAKKLVDEMNTKFGKTWICQIGSNNSELYIDLESSSYITLSFKEIKISLYKISLNNPNNSTNANLVSYNQSYCTVI